MGCSSSIPYVHHPQDALGHKVHVDENLGLSVERKHHPNQKKISKEKVISEVTCHRLIADANLKALLTHPTIRFYLLEYAHFKNRERLLLCYYDILQVRTMAKTASKGQSNSSSPASTPSSSSKLGHKGMYDMFVMILREYFADDAPQLIPVRAHYKDMMFECLDVNKSLLYTSFLRGLEGLKLVQNEILLMIKETIWLPFCQTDDYKVLLKKKEVRMMVSLYNTSNQTNNVRIKYKGDPSKDSFTSLVSGEAASEHLSIRSIASTSRTDSVAYSKRYATIGTL